ncbi:MAG: histidine kinase dimerization/phospho-acceptor domain-containing protein, partial [Methylococcaceae bacterium]
MVIFSHFQTGTHLVRSWAVATVVLTAGFFVFGTGPMLPRWVTVIGANMALLTAIPILQAGFLALRDRCPPKPDRWGFGIVILTVPGFWYWGLIEPNGIYRSTLFSFAVMLACAPVARLLFQAARRRIGGKPTWILALIFGVITVWMAGRGVLLLVGEQPSGEMRGINPTTWVTVFWYIILVTLASLGVVWLEVSRQTPPTSTSPQRSTQPRGVIEYFRHKLLLLWSAVIILLFAIISELGIAYTNAQALEKAEHLQMADRINDAFVAHTDGITNQLDMLLQSVCGFYRHTGSLADTEAFMASLQFDSALIEDIYWVDVSGTIVIARTPAMQGATASNQAFFASHREASADDRIVIAPWNSASGTGRAQYLWIRPLRNQDGVFAGLMMVAVNLETLTNSYRNIATGMDSFAMLLGLEDNRLRIRINESSTIKNDDLLNESLFWKLVSSATNDSHHEEIHTRNGQTDLLVFRKIAKLPLVLITGFEQADVDRGARERTRWLWGSSLLFAAFIMILAVLLTLEVKRRDEQDHFISMLSHEIKTPMSVIRMALGITNLSPTIKNRISRSISDMTAIIDRCLLSDRLQCDRVDISLEPCQVQDILTEIRAGCAAPDQVILSIQPLPPCRTDAQLLRIIIGNLVDNAVKYGAMEGAITLTAEPVDYKRCPGITIAVENMPGMAGMPDPKQVFKKYYRASGAHVKTCSFLVLHIARNIVQKLG